MDDLRDHHQVGGSLDHLIDVLLREELSGAQPVDMTSRVMAAISSPAPGSTPNPSDSATAAASSQRDSAPLGTVNRRTILHFRHSALWGIAALIIVAVAVAFAWRGLRYPPPEASGAFTLVVGSSVVRGSTIATTSAPAALALGGYVQVDLQPHTTVAISGSPKAEQIHLRQGEVTCRVQPGRGSFDVVTDLGTVSVTGTQFTVGLQQGDPRMIGKQLWVKVLVGSVLLATAGDRVTLAAGDEKTVPQSGTTTGLVVAKGDNAITVKDATTNESVKFLPRWIGGNPDKGGGLDKEILAVIRKTELGTKVKVDWVLAEGKRAVKIEVLEAPPKSGTASGVITALGDTWVTIKDATGESQRFAVKWVGGAPKDGGGPDKEMVKILGYFRVGDKVIIGWELAEGRRIVSIKKVE